MTSRNRQIILEKNLNLGKTKLRYLEVDNSRHLHINFGNYKKGKKARDVHTYTIYNSIYEKDKSYCEIWLDKQNGKPIGVEVMWDS